MAAQYLLDTNILLAYVRLNRLYTATETAYALLTTSPVPAVSVVTEGEIRAFAEEFSWGAAKRRVMEDLLTYFTTVPLPFGSVIEDYVRVSEYSRKRGRVVGKNDLWIAATSVTTSATLLTTDRDFDHLNPDLLTHHWIHPTI